MEAYKEELLSSKGQYLKVISLPTFATSHSIVLLDMESLQSFEVVFDLSENVISKDKMRKSNVNEEK